MSSFNIKVSKEEKQSIYVSSGLLILGYALATFMKSPDMFARFGSLIVCVGVLFSIKGLPQLVDSAKSIYDEQIKMLRDSIESACEGHQYETEMRAQMAEVVEPEIVKLEISMNKQVHFVRNRLLRIEGAIVIVGTLTWGFGDLLVLR
ncbi:hypothetical protein [Kangiella shandongensis]|uniref:hypothetical protein n=1 Tax=Kangiella shandongensis TaxID=2763258 RepID=UPI001CC1521C|nr:hypothetical protein [Kangiella shandongensis]